MKLSNETLSVLKNFATINANLVVKEGNVISTLSDQKNVMARAEVIESFPNEFGIYDLNEFLGALNLMDSPELEFNGQNINIFSPNHKTQLKYRLSDISILSYPQNEIKMPDVDLIANVSHDIINQVRKAGSVLKCPVVSIMAEGDGYVKIRVFDPVNSAANVYEIKLEETTSKAVYDFQFLIDNLKMLPDDYVVSISSKLISQWHGINNNINYWIALEKNSSYAK